MSKAMLEHGSNPEIQNMAEKIVNEQTKEINALDDWLIKNAEQNT